MEVKLGSCTSVTSKPSRFSTSADCRGSLVCDGGTKFPMRFVAEQITTPCSTLSCKGNCFVLQCHQNAIQSCFPSRTVRRGPSCLAITGRSEEALLWSHEGYIEEVPHSNQPAWISCSRQVHILHTCKVGLVAFVTVLQSGYRWSHIHADTQPPLRLQVVRAVTSVTECALPTLVFEVISGVTSKLLARRQFVVSRDNFKARQGVIVSNSWFDKFRYQEDMLSVDRHNHMYVAVLVRIRSSWKKLDTALKRSSLTYFVKCLVNL